MGKSENMMIIGACGQIGTELVQKLSHKYGKDCVVATDIKTSSADLSEVAIFEQLDVLNKDRIRELIIKHDIAQVYLLAAMLSATAETRIKEAWDINVNGLMNVLELAREGLINKIFWPSSIAVFGPDTPKEDCPQTTIMNPDTVYGISKLAGERWCEYYHNKFNVDVRSIRFPGLIGAKSLPGGGTTDYAVHMYYKASEGEKYECFLDQDTTLPMMYMDDAVRGTIELMAADANKIEIRSSYNLNAFSMNPRQQVEAIQNHYPAFKCAYNPDFRQKIASGWPASIDDSKARSDWNWNHQYDLGEMTSAIFNYLGSKQTVS